MKRRLHTAGIAVAATALCLTAATNAQAATGKLTINSKTYQDPPSGTCYNPNPLRVTTPTGGVLWYYIQVSNQTDRTVLVYFEKNCSGNPSGGFAPGESGNPSVSKYGGSVKVGF
ncbi:hypothetical protein ABTZ03_30455 [Kitasatospora sp. NPDC096077]|uniref:hypothetical protein n=1 Tax=Kitasatospora sp. NPDC096077 TaxID=3155544 RepID=UPI00332CBFEB